jgi:hypothetical protein
MALRIMKRKRLGSAQSSGEERSQEELSPCSCSCVMASGGEGV